MVLEYVSVFHFSLLFIGIFKGIEESIWAYILDICMLFVIVVNAIIFSLVPILMIWWCRHYLDCG